MKGRMIRDRQWRSQGQFQTWVRFPYLAKPLKPWPKFTPKLNLYFLDISTWLTHDSCVALPSCLPVFSCLSLYAFILLFTCFSSVLSSQNEELNRNHFPAGPTVNPLFVPAWKPYRKNRGDNLKSQYIYIQMSTEIWNHKSTNPHYSCNNTDL